MKFETFYKDVQNFNNVANYIQNRITELKFGVEFSSLLDDAKVVARKDKITVNDLDKLVSVNGELIAAFELKVKRFEPTSYIKIPWHQWRTLRVVSTKLGIPIFYLIKLRKSYQLIKLRFDWKHLKDGFGQTEDEYVQIPYDEGLNLSKNELIFNLADILRGASDE